MLNVLKRPVISEKTIGLSKQQFYTFLVDKKARKPQIAKAVRDQFNVEVLSVKVMSVKPVTKMQRSRKGFYQIGAFKKAIISVKAGQKIDLFDLETQKEDVVVRTAEGEPIAVTKEKKSATKVKVEKPASDTKAEQASQTDTLSAGQSRRKAVK